MNEKKKVVIEVGTLATGSYYSDCYPYEVIAITPSGKTVTIRRLDSEPAEGYDYFSNQVHTFTSNPNNEEIKVRLGKFGWKSSAGLRVSFGFAKEYRNPEM